MSLVSAARPFVPYKDRNRHVYIAGSSQHGKSTLLENAIVQDIRRGAGVILLDGKGDLAKSVIHHVPQSDIERSIYLDAANPVPIDFMSWDTERERSNLSSDIYRTFMSFSSSITGDRWVNVLRRTIATLLVAKNCSFMDIHDFLEYPARRKEILKRVKDETLQYFWERTFPSLPADAKTPITMRMTQFSDSAPLKTLLGCSKPELDILDVMQKRMILLVDLSGAGDENVNDIGRLLMSKIQQCTFKRIEKRERIPCMLYVDEFQKFQTTSFAEVLAEAGGFRLCLTLANQGFYQLEQNIRSAMFANVTALRVAFHISHEDIPHWKHLCEGSDVRPTQLAHLDPYEAFYKVGTETGFIAPTQPPLEKPPVSYAAAIRKRTLDLYYRPPDKRDLGLSEDGKPDDFKSKEPAKAAKKTSTHQGKAGSAKRPR